MKNLENLTIHSFRGLQDISLESLGQINLFVGVNNSGKTSVLEAISTYCRPLDPLEWLNTAWRREIKSSRKPQLEALKWLFPQNGTVGEFSWGETHISGDGKFAVRESRSIYQEFEEIWADPDRSIGRAFPSAGNLAYDIEEVNLSPATVVRGAEVKLKATIEKEEKLPDLEISESFVIWENRNFVKRRQPGTGEGKSEIMLPVDAVTPFSHAIEQLQVELLSSATLAGFKPEVIKLLQVMDKEIDDLQILSHRGDSPRLYVSHKQTGMGPLSACGEGVCRLLSIALTLAKVRGGVLLIDDLETAIHTLALKPALSWLVQACQQMDVQLFATTHSLETVDELLDASEEIADLVLYRLYPRESRTKLIRNDWKRLKRLREDVGMEVRW